MERHGRRRLYSAIVLMVAMGLAGCPGDEPIPPPDEFAYVVVEEVLGVSGGAYTWIVEFDLLNEEGNGQYFVRFLGPDDCVSESAAIFVPAGRDWSDEFAVNCRLQPDQVVMFSLRSEGFAVTDRDSIPPIPEP